MSSVLLSSSVLHVSSKYDLNICTPMVRPYPHAYICMLSGDPANAHPHTLHVPAPTPKSPTVTNKQHPSHGGSLSRKGTGFGSLSDRNNNALLFKGRRSRSLSASEQLGVTSQLPPKRPPNCENVNDENRGIFVWLFGFHPRLLRSSFALSGWCSAV